MKDKPIKVTVERMDRENSTLEDGSRLLTTQDEHKSTRDFFRLSPHPEKKELVFFSFQKLTLIHCVTFHFHLLHFFISWGLG